MPQKTYLDKVEGYSGEKVRYVGESIEGDYAVLKVKIVPDRSEEISVDYRLRKKDNNWFVYDISIEGVSLVNNYRVQFNNILMRSSYQKLVRRLREKMAEE